MKTTLSLALMLLAITGCGSPAKTSSGGGPQMPNMAGTWNGTIYLSPSGTADLTVVLTEDSLGKLTGTASSTQGCAFNVAVTGAIYSDSTFSVSTGDFTTVSIAGSMTNGSEASGYMNLNVTGCGYQTDRSFALGR
jgi:hypothetical protein